MFKVKHFQEFVGNTYYPKHFYFGNDLFFSLITKDVKKVRSDKKYYTHLEYGCKEDALSKSGQNVTNYARIIEDSFHIGYIDIRSIQSEIQKCKIYNKYKSNYNYDPDNSKIVCYKDNYYYTYYLNSKTNYMLKNVKFLLHIGFLDSIIKDGFLTILYNNGEIIGFRTKKGKTTINFNQNNKKLVEFYSKFIEKTQKYGIIMLDCCNARLL